MNNLSQGILILDSGCEIVFTNTFLCKILKRESSELLHRKVYDALPGFNSPCFHSLFSLTLNKRFHFFLSAAIHKNILSCREHLNIRLSRWDIGDEKYLFFEFIDVTAEYERIMQLKKNIRGLCLLNRELLEKEKVIQNLAYYDSLTGVANRTLFYELARKMIQAAERNGEMLGMMFIDIDKFKSINDNFGHEMGDKVLCRVAEILSGATRKNDVVARYGGDEFLVLLPQIREKKNCLIVADKIFNAKNSSVCLNGVCINISLSIGVSFYPDDSLTVDKLIAKADHAMYLAKRHRGKSGSICACGQPVRDWKI